MSVLSMVLSTRALLLQVLASHQPTSQCQGNGMEYLLHLSFPAQASEEGTVAQRRVYAAATCYDTQFTLFGHKEANM